METFPKKEFPTPSKERSQDPKDHKKVARAQWSEDENPLLKKKETPRNMGAYWATPAHRHSDASWSEEQRAAFEAWQKRPTHVQYAEWLLARQQEGEGVWRCPECHMGCVQCASNALGNLFPAGQVQWEGNFHMRVTNKGKAPLSAREPP